ncbi:excisionase, partial [Salmonella enterica]|nr:excisionase [Salmonella enterica]EBY5841190.1 excisionase [Salmonella enterica subsp. enterica serovar Poona]ECR8296164.1 excisionase [Salmonella enterica]EHK5301384.1 excisionase [Salmonella enterica]EHQ3297979.1 excisionase [Salmonella enterica]
YRVSSRPKSPYLFTREDCQAALLAVEVEPTKLRDKERKVEAEVAFTRSQKEVNEKLRRMLNMPEKE